MVHQVSMALLTGQSTDAPAQGCDAFQMMPIFLMVAIFWLIVLRPARKEREEHQAMLGALKRGDDVVTSSGIVGKITDIADNLVTLEIARNVKVKFLKSAIAKKHAMASSEEEAKGGKS